MKAYIWQLGIDWNAVETAGTTPESYLRGCLSLDGVLLPGTQKAEQGDTITFKIFDVTSAGTEGVNSIESLEILSAAAVKDQQIQCGLGLEPSQPTDPLEFTQNQITRDQPTETNSAFGDAQASWTVPAVYVTAAEGRFLLTPQVRATGGVDGAPRLFSMDPEMVVGSSL